MTEVEPILIRPFRKNIANVGDIVIVAYGKHDTQLIKLCSAAISQNKFGALKHDEIIGKPYGSRIVTSRGHVNILALDPVIWAAALPHRTQIIYPVDTSMIVGRLDLVPGRQVLEAGTGSGALTHALAQAVWPSGRVCTLDFHHERVQRASAEFEEHGLGGVVSVYHCDVLAEGFPASGTERNPDGCDAVMIDLPEPWSVIPRLVDCFRRPSGGRVCVFSPCIEQVQRTCENLLTAGFTDVEVLECVSRNYDFVHTVLHVPNLGQKDATDLWEGTYRFRRPGTSCLEGEGKNPRACHGDRHLLPPPDKYIHPTPPCKENARGRIPGRHQEGSWEAYPKAKDIGHTGYLTFASLIPKSTACICGKTENNTDD